MLNNKNVLLIVPKYFGYEKVIKKAIEKEGAKVISIYENLTELSYVYDFINYHIKSLRNKLFDDYYLNIIKKINFNIDYVLVIRGWSISSNVIGKMKQQFGENTKYIFWQWDSVKNNPNALLIEKLFNNVLTFDIKDSEKYKWMYRPDFFVEEYADEINKKDVDLMFIGSYSDDRYELVKKVRKICQSNNLIFDNYMYIKRKDYLYLKYVLKKDLNKEDFIFKSLDLRELYNLYGKCKIVIEHVSNTQSGLTMRPLDCLANNCKLVTNNKYIEKEDFFNEKNILVYGDISKLNITNDFINSDYIEIDKNIKNKYSLKQWVEDIFNII